MRLFWVRTAGVLILCGGVAPVGVAQGAWVPLDISSEFNFDAVATQNEITANPGGVVAALGDHIVHTNRTYVDDASAGAGVGLPNDGIIGNFKTSTAFDSGSPYTTKSNNTIFLGSNNNTVSKTVILPGVEQGQYDQLDLLFTSVRGSAATYRTFISATYTDASTSIIFDTGDVAAGASDVGGTLGSAGIGSKGGLRFADDHPGVALALQSTRLYSGSISSSSAYLWHLSAPLELDGTKVLQSLTFSVKSVGVNRTNHLYLLGVSANAVPEPTTMAFAALATACLTTRRRRR